jgi:hypothetical protein
MVKIIYSELFERREFFINVDIRQNDDSHLLNNFS